MATALLYLAVIVAGLAIAGFASRRHKQRIAKAHLLAAQHGFEVDTTSKPPPGQRFDQFDVGRSKKVSVQFWRAGEDDSVFEYQYTTGSGKNSTTYHRTLALVRLPFAAPHTKIGPEGFWSGIGRAVGIRDIEVESAVFNDRYRVTSDDERFAVTLLDHQMLAWLLSPASGGGAIKFEVWGAWLLCVSDKLDIEQMFGYLDWAQSVRTHMPDVLASLYPIA